MTSTRVAKHTRGEHLHLGHRPTLPLRGRRVKVLERVRAEQASGDQITGVERNVGKLAGEHHQ